MVLTKLSVRLTYITYIHYTSTPLTWITEKELKQEIKEKYETFIAALENEKSIAATKVKMSGSEKKSEQEHIQHFLHKTSTCMY